MATVQAYTKSGVDAKFNSRSNMTMVHNGGGSPDISAYPDSKTGDVIERASDGARWSVVASTINPIAGRVVSVVGKTGVVTLGPGDVGAAPSNHTHTKAQITDLNASTAVTSNTIAQRGSGGVLLVGTPTDATHATTKAYVDSQLTKYDNAVVRLNSTTSSISGSTTDAGSIVTLSDRGRITAVNPSWSNDVANKQYVDAEISDKTTWANISDKPSTYPHSAHTHTVAQITGLTLSQTTTGSSVVQRDSSGRATVATPTATGHATTKAYVDNAVTAGKAWAAITGKPSTFTPSAHTHTRSQITDLPTVATSASNNSIVQRTSTGQVQVPNTPINTQDATSKRYVDSKFETTELFTENLNDVITSGNYYQGLKAQATTDRNYPAGAEGGHLVVTKSNEYSVKQEYTDYLSRSIHYRTKHYTTWYPWQSISQSTV